MYYKDQEEVLLTKEIESQIAKQLVHRIQQGDKAAEAEMIERYQRGLLFMLRHRSKNSDLANDIAQETWRIVLEKIRGNSIKSPSKLAAFIVQIGKNQLTMSYRGAHNTNVNIDDISPIDTQPKPQQILERNNISLVVRKLLQELTVPRDKELMMRFYIKEEDKKTICEALALDDLHFNRVLFRARHRFKEIWQSYIGNES